MPRNESVERVKTKQCLVCNATFHKPPHYTYAQFERNSFCSMRCYSAFKRQNAKPKPTCTCGEAMLGHGKPKECRSCRHRFEKVCKNCSVKFLSVWFRQETCSDKCSRESKRRNKNEWGRSKLRETREIVIKHYGGKCSCCGEDRYEFLAIDHVNGGGGKHRKSLGSSSRRLPSLVVSSGFPDDYRILCHNCNMAIGFYKKCPHESL